MNTRLERELVGVVGGSGECEKDGGFGSSISDGGSCWTIFKIGKSRNRCEVVQNVASDAKRSFARQDGDKMGDRMEQVSIDGCNKVYICLSTTR